MALTPNTKSNGKAQPVDPPTEDNLARVVRQLKLRSDYREGLTREGNQRHVTIQDLIDVGLIADGDIV